LESECVSQGCELASRFPQRDDMKGRSEGREREREKRKGRERSAQEAEDEEGEE
jgi:hypothetical protein